METAVFFASTLSPSCACIACAMILLDLSAYDVLAKPFERAELVSTVLRAAALAPTAGVPAKVVNAVHTAS